jgi:hypothetical protein
LAGDAPGLDVFHPLEVGLFPVLGYELGSAIADRGHGWLSQFGGVAIPLFGQPRLDGDARTVAVGNGVEVILDLFEQALGFEIGDDAFAGFETVEAVVGRLRSSDFAERIHDVDHFKVMAAADFKVVEVVGRRDLDRAGAFFGIGVVVAEDRDVAID